MTDHKVVRIAWEDAASVDEWTPKADISPSLALIITIGMLVTENDTAVTIGLSHDTSSDNFSSFIHIPKAWIVSRDEIKLSSGSRPRRRKQR